VQELRRTRMMVYSGGMMIRVGREGDTRCHWSMKTQRRRQTDAILKSSVAAMKKNSAKQETLFF